MLNRIVCTTLLPLLWTLAIAGDSPAVAPTAGEAPAGAVCAPAASRRDHRSRRNDCPARSKRGKPGNAAFPRVVGVARERLNADGEWVELPSDEAMWVSDSLRWAPVLKPNDPSQVRSVRMLMSPFGNVKAPWIVFAQSEPGELWAYGEPGVGVWECAIQVQFSEGLPVLKVLD